jgi:hypothetical protein
MSDRCESAPKLANALRVLRERDALNTRVRILEGALACIEHETERALSDPSLAWIVTRRVAAVARQAVHRTIAPPSGVGLSKAVARCVGDADEPAPPSGVVARTVAMRCVNDRAS